MLWDRLRYAIMYIDRLSKKRYDITRHIEDNLLMLRTTTVTRKMFFEIWPRGKYRNGRITRIRCHKGSTSRFNAERKSDWKKIAAPNLLSSFPMVYY